MQTDILFFWLEIKANNENPAHSGGERVKFPVLKSRLNCFNPTTYGEGAGGVGALLHCSPDCWYYIVLNPIKVGGSDQQ